MNKPEMTKQRESRERKEFKDRVKPYIKFIERILFGTGSITTSAVAAYAVINKLDLTIWQERAILVAVAITLTPAVLATGRYIVQGAFNAAKEAKE